MEVVRGIIFLFIFLGVNGFIEISFLFILIGLLGISCFFFIWGTFFFCFLFTAGFVLGDDSVRDLFFGSFVEFVLFDFCFINEVDLDLRGDVVWGVFSWRDFIFVRFGDFFGEGVGSLLEFLCLEDFWFVSNRGL